MRETQVQLLGWEDPLEKEMATHSSILAWKIPWMEEPGELQSMGLKESDTTEQLHFLFFLFLFITSKYILNPVSSTKLHKNYLYCIYSLRRGLCLPGPLDFGPQYILLKN